MSILMNAEEEFKHIFKGVHSILVKLIEWDKQIPATLPGIYSFACSYQIKTVMLETMHALSIVIDLYFVLFFFFFYRYKS